MTNRRSFWDWSLAYVGDPNSWEARGKTIFNFMFENGLEKTNHVLDIGCGNLNTGLPLMNYLQPKHYVGIEPNGWLVEAALQQHPHLENKELAYSDTTDFDVSDLKVTFDHVVSHSVLSHAAHWQVPQAFMNVRKVVREGAVWLASIRLSDKNSFDKQWVYPGVSTFRLQTLKVWGHHAGWMVEHLPEYTQRLTRVAPNDFHDWLRLTAVPSASQMNDMRVEEEKLQAEEQEILEIAEAEYQRRREQEQN